MPEEPTVDLADVGAHVRAELLAFQSRDGRRLALEIEPGTYLVARAGAVVASCIDVVDTGRDGYLFAKLDTGMTEVTRPSLYGAQHPIDVLVQGREAAAVVFVGPCCESGDILTPAPGEPEALGPRWVPRPRIGDLVVVSGAGAYCAAMSTDQLQLVPARPRGDAGAGRLAPPAPASAGAHRRLGGRDLRSRSRSQRAARRRYSDGVEPVQRRKARLKALTSE